MKRALALFVSPALLALLTACDSGGDGADPSDAAVDTDGDATAPVEDAQVEGDGTPPLSLRSVSGDLTFAEIGPRGGHLFSLQADGQVKQRITADQAFWSHHAVGPDPRYVLAVRHRDGDGDGNDDPDGPGEVWLIDVRDRTSFPLSPAGCDAGIGGVGWRDEVRVMFSMSCDGAPAVIYLASSQDRSRSVATMLPVTSHDVPVRDVFPAVATPLFTYVVEAEACSAGGSCITKPQIWVGDADIGLRCRVTDGDTRFTDTSTITGPRRHLGDHAPAFNGDLSSVTFSRNVGGKGRGPEGHLDLMRVGLDRRALFRGDELCVQGGTLTNLSDELFDDALNAQERFPRGPAGRAPTGSVLYTSEITNDTEVLQSNVVVVSPTGERTALTAEGGRAAFATWIVTDYLLDGER
jgi:hypothetical protein